MTVDFQRSMTRTKCHLFAWHLLRPFVASDDAMFSFGSNFIEIRFSGAEEAIDEHLAVELRHIYSHIYSQGT